MSLMTAALSSFLIRSIPQMGQDPGPSRITSGCMEQVHTSFALIGSVGFFPLSLQENSRIAKQAIITPINKLYFRKLLFIISILLLLSFPVLPALKESALPGPDIQVV